MEKVLIIDDEASLTDVLEFTLRREGFQPVVCRGARDGLQAFAREKPAVVLLDLGLPDGSGLDLCRSLRQNSDVPIIIITCRDEETDKVVGLEVGADDYLTKPLGQRELVARLRALLRRSRGLTPAGAPAADHGFGPFRVHRQKFRILYQGKSLPLSKTEFEITELLVRNPGRVFTRNEILDLIWGTNYVATDRTIDTHIKSIRKKIHAVDSRSKLIETVRGVGYRLRENGA